MQISRSTRIPALLGAALAAATALTLAVSGTASAAPGDTTVTFTVTAGGGLTIAVPAGPVSLGLAVTPGSSPTSLLGGVTVTDARAAIGAGSNWTASVTSTDFTTGATPTAAQTIPKADVSYWSGPSTSTTGSGTFAPGEAAVGDAVVLDGVPAAATAFSHTAGNGSNAATWNPTLIVAVPATAVTGAYTGTVNHSIA